MRKVLLVLLLALATGPARAQDATIRGVVVDSAQGAPMPGANVRLLDRPRGTATGQDGRFVLDGLAPGRYRLKCTFVGYRPARHTLTLEAGEKVSLRFVLAAREIVAEEVVVTGRRLEEAGLGGLGSATPETADLRAMPGLGQGDLFRGLRRLPGVSATTDLSTDLHVRGGAPGHTLVRLDEATLFNTGHAMGLFSAFNPDAVDEVALHRGVYPTRYGGRLGSVLQLRTGPSAEDGVHGSLQGGLLASRIALSGSHPGGDWLVSGRRSTFEPMLRELSAREVDGLPRRFWFYDVNGRAAVRAGEGHRLEVSVFGTEDRLELPVNAKLLFDAVYDQQAGTLRGTHRLGETVRARWHVAGSRYRSDARVHRTRVPFARRVEVRSEAAGTELTHRPGPRLEWTIGGRVARRHYDVRDVHLEDTRLDRRRRTIGGAAFLSTTLRPTARWTVDLGVRARHQRPGRFWRISPRARLSVRPWDRLRLELAAGRQHQFLTRTGRPTLSAFDVWLPAGPGVGPARSDRATAGLEWEITDCLRLELGGYARRMEGIFRLDRRIPDATGRSYGELFLTGKGYAYGGEAALRREEGRLTGLIAYTWGRTERRYPTINDFSYYPAAFDRRHDLDAVLQLRLGRGWALTGAYRYASARPTTRPVGYYTLVDAPYQGHRHATFVAPRHNARLAPYRRMDLGLRKSGGLFGAARYRVDLQVINVLGHANVWYRAYEVDRSYEVRRTSMPQIPVPLPNLSVRLEL